MARIEPDNVEVNLRIDLRLQPTCISCGNNRAFYILTDGETSLWTVRDPMPDGAKVTACGRCRSRNSVMMAYSD